jgi:hypothetical protein
VLGFALLGVVGSLGSDIAPSWYIPELEHYIPRYILLALAVGSGLSAARSRQQIDRLLGIPVLVVGAGMVVYIIKSSLRLIAG